MKRADLVFVLTMLVASISTTYFTVQPVRGSGTIYIRADGSIDPPTANITSSDNLTYTFTSNNYDPIVLEKDDIVVDGEGFVLQGPGGLFTDSKGISLSGRNVTIVNVEIREFTNGIWLNMSSHNTLYWNNVTENQVGIYLDSSQNNTLVENDVKDNMWGIWLWNSSKNILIANTVTENGEFGIYISNSEENQLRDNQMSGNLYNFYLSTLHPPMNDIDTSNTVDGKPIYYWTGEQDKAVPLDAGYVALINCANMTVRNLTLTNNGGGILLANVTNSKITGNNITDNFYGFQLCASSHTNTISANKIVDSGVGISLSRSPNNTISMNTITNALAICIMVDWNSSGTIISGNVISESQLGIQLMFSSNNTITGNNITDNQWGIQLNNSPYLSCTSDNNIYHNNFIHNTQHVWVLETGEIPPSSYTNSWDDGYPSGGNYWSDYESLYPNATEIDGSGVWNTPYVIDENNIDNYPLIPEFSSSIILLFLIVATLFITRARHRKNGYVVNDVTRAFVERIIIKKHT